jgi:amidophosphoribosyltransferase
MKEGCGIFAAWVGNEAKLYDILHSGISALQHRGQESCGVSFLEKGIKTKKRMGLVAKLFEDEEVRGLRGKAGIAHVRYSTFGRRSLKNAQPFEKVSNYGVRYSLAFNGNIVNYWELRKGLEKEGYKFKGTGDGELLAILFGKDLGKLSLLEIYRDVHPRILGSYSCVMLIDDKKPKIAAFRDPLGFKPLCLGKGEGGWVVSSESVSIDYLNHLGGKYRLLRDVEPGEVLLIDEKLESEQVVSSPKHWHCMFEWVYFARPESLIEGKLVYQVRKKLGEELAKNQVEAEIAIPIPDSGRSAAIGFSSGSGIRFEEGFIKDRYNALRTFIMPEQRDREKATRKKLNPISKVFEGKKVAVIDDSIVRGTSMKTYVKELKDHGAREVHLKISCPPLIFECKFGVDFYNDELVARKVLKRLGRYDHSKICEGVAREIGADSLFYNKLESLISCIGLPKEELCLACLTGEYPFKSKERRKEEVKGEGDASWFWGERTCDCEEHQAKQKS